MEDRIIILNRNNDAIAKWLDRRYEDRAKAMKAIYQQETGQTSIISFMGTIEHRRQFNSDFQTRLLGARRAALSTSSNTVDGINHQKNPGLNSSLQCFSFPSLYPSFNVNLSTLRGR